jgi:L-fuculose-phosphate aldolase
MRGQREKMCELGRRAYARQLVAGTEGNFSCRLEGGSVLCTPTGLCKGLLTPADLCKVDLDGRQVAGQRTRSSEILMHVGVYRAAPHIHALIHAHPPFATTYSVLGAVDLAAVLPECDVFLGPVPLVPYQTPGTADMAAALLPFLDEHVAVLLQNHGTVTWGRDLESAYVLTETLEAVCRVMYQAQQLGPVRHIAPDQCATLARLRQQLRADAKPPTA